MNASDRPASIARAKYRRREMEELRAEYENAAEDAWRIAIASWWHHEDAWLRDVSLCRVTFRYMRHEGKEALCRMSRAQAEMEHVARMHALEYDE